MDVEECAKIMGTKGKRILDTHNADVAGESFLYKKSYTVKWNETLPAKEVTVGEDHVQTIKPRAICNLDPIFHSRTTQWARALSEWMHNTFSMERVHQYGPFRVRIVFCSGMTADDLDKLGGYMVNPMMDMQADFVLAVAGDDSVARLMLTDHTTHFSRLMEGDFTMYDQSQDDGPLKSSSLWMKALRIPADVQALWYDSFSKGYKSKMKQVFRIEGETTPQLATGSTITTDMNSLNNIFMYLHWLMTLVEKAAFLDVATYDIYGQLDDAQKVNAMWKNAQMPTGESLVEAFHLATLPKAASELGFTLKMKVYKGNDLQQATFLKGMWVLPYSQFDDKTNFRWMPLPSAVIKLGKLLRDPSELTPQAANPMEACAYMIAKSYSYVPPEYPILGPFLQVMLREPYYGKVRSGEFLTESYQKPKRADTPLLLDIEDCKYQIKKRYKISDDQLESVTALIQSVEKLPSYIEHEVFRILMETDYS